MDVTADLSGPEVIGLVGAVLAAVAAFLPWVTAAINAGPITAGVVATGVESIGILTLFLASAAALVILLPGVGSDGPVATGLVGVAVVLVGVGGIVSVPSVASPGSGLYLTAVGGLALVIGALLEYASRLDPESGVPQ